MPSTKVRICENAFSGCRDLAIIAPALSSLEIIEDGSLSLYEGGLPRNNNVCIYVPFKDVEGIDQGVIPVKGYCRDASDILSLSEYFDDTGTGTGIGHEHARNIVDSTMPDKLRDDIDIELLATTNLKEYLKSIYDSERQVAFMENALECLIDADAKMRSCADFSLAHASDILATETAELTRKARGLRNGSIAPSDIKSIGEPPPFVKAPPGRRLKEPTAINEPQYETPLFFNRKKVERTNAEMKAAYESQLEEYRRKLEAYNEETRQIEAAKKKHEDYLASSKEYGRKKKRLAEDEACAIESQAKSYVENEQAKLQAASETSRAFFKQLVKEAEQALRSAASALKALYSLDIVFPKYRNLSAMATMYEYVASGRCSTLEGPDGAYNLFESEIRADRVIARLEDIADSLEQVKANQYMLYQAVQETNKTLRDIRSDIKDEGMKISQAITDNTQELQAIRQTAQEIAHNSAAAAHWAKKNAELTNSLGYLIAFDALT